MEENLLERFLLKKSTANVDSAEQCQASDSILIVESKEEHMLTLVCEELANPNSRAVLDSIWNGLETASEVAERLGMTSQAVNFHLGRLKKAGLIRVKGIWSEFRGRGARHYEPSKLGILMLPIDLGSHRKEALDIVGRVLADRLEKTLLSSIVLSLIAAALSYLFVTQTVPQEIGFYGGQLNIALLTISVLIGASVFWITRKLLSRLDNF